LTKSIENTSVHFLLIREGSRKASEKGSWWFCTKLVHVYFAFDTALRDTHHLQARVTFGFKRL